MNPSIATFLNDQTAHNLKHLFLNKPLLSDVAFEVDGGAVVYAHKALLPIRCEFFGGMFSGLFAEARLELVPFADVSEETFLALLEYLYTAHAPVDQCADPVGVLMFANRLRQPRLVELCELFISKHVDVTTRDRIEKADIDICGLLQTAHTFGAPQLAAFCLHFIASNFIAFARRPEFQALPAADRAHIRSHQWPPQQYLDDLAAYKKRTGKNVEENAKGTSADVGCSIM